MIFSGSEEKNEIEYEVRPQRRYTQRRAVLKRSIPETSSRRRGGNKT
jgi:hypothetical protein